MDVLGRESLDIRALRDTVVVNILEPDLPEIQMFNTAYNNEVIPDLDSSPSPLSQPNKEL